MFVGRRSVVTGFVLIAMGCVPVAQAAAKQKPIKLSVAKKFTVVALDKNGESTSVSGKGKLKLVPPSSKVTLHLISTDGSYFGPVVVGRKGSKAVEGVRAGASIGALKLRSGYATAKAPKSAIVSSLAAKASSAGAPIGAGKNGLIKTTASGKVGQGTDQDGDGIPGSYDIDDNGNLIIDNVDATQARASSVSAHAAADEAGPGQPPGGGVTSEGGFRVFSNFKLDITESLNANATAVTQEQIDSAMSANQTLAIEVASGDSVALDCNGLTYCSAGGTGHNLSTGSFNNPPSFPDPGNSDAAGNGYITAGSTGDFQLLTGATSSQIGSGDALTEIVTSGGAQTELPGVLNFAFISTPALTSVVADGKTQTVNYPVGQSDPGTMNTPFIVSGSGDVTATMTFWRPQRRAIESAGEGTGFMDIGKLTYVADVGGPAPQGSFSTVAPSMCPVSSYTAGSADLQIGTEGVDDLQVDRAADPANSLTFTVNLTSCLAAKGLTWSSGETLGVDIQARSLYSDNSAQKIYFKRP